MYTLNYKIQCDCNMKAHYNFYFTMEHSEISKMSMFVYLLLVLLIGALCGAIYDLFKLIVAYYFLVICLQLKNIMI